MAVLQVIAIIGVLLISTLSKNGGLFSVLLIGLG